MAGLDKDLEIPLERPYAIPAANALFFLTLGGGAFYKVGHSGLGPKAMAPAIPFIAGLFVLWGLFCLWSVITIARHGRFCIHATPEALSLPHSQMPWRTRELMRLRWKQVLDIQISPAHALIVVAEWGRLAFPKRWFASEAAVLEAARSLKERMGHEHRRLGRSR